MNTVYFLLLVCCGTSTALKTGESLSRNLLASVRRHGKGLGKLSACAGKRIHILDLNDIAEANGTPVCKFAKVCLAIVVVVPLVSQDGWSARRISSFDGRRYHAMQYPEFTSCCRMPD